jgi:molybdopterin-containing oxidoreductase family iron-sulfur binding subunit
MTEQLERVAAPEGAAAKTNVGVSRRSFIGKVFIAAGAVTLGSKTVAFADDVMATDNEDAPQWAMVIDLERCDGCKECTTACQDTHFTGDQEWIKVFEVKDEAGNTVFLPRPCMQCENAPCLNVCPVGATFRNENGTVLIDHELCIGCRFCMAACPYDARSFNWGEPENPPGATFARYSPEFPVPHRRGTADKCMFCAHNAMNGQLPACASACSMSAIWFGDLKADIATNGLETVQLSWLLSERNAYRLKEELGTRPRVWYLPGHGEHSKVVLPQ